MPKANIVAIRMNSLRGVSSPFRLIVKETCLGLVFVSFTKMRGRSARKAIAAAIRKIVLNCKLRNQNRMKARMDPRMAPEVSMALCIPNPFPLAFLAAESAIMPSLGAVLMPLPNLSRGFSSSRCCQVVISGKKSFDVDEMV